MSKLVKKNKIGLCLILLGLLSVFTGIHRNEHLTVLNKSNIICLECIGIG